MFGSDCVVRGDRARRGEEGSIHSMAVGGVVYEIIAGRFGNP